MWGKANDERVIGEAKRAFQKQLDSLGRAPGTLAWYNDSIEQFFAFFWDQDPVRPLTKLSAADVESFLIYLRRAGRADSTVNARYRALRRFFRWLKAQRYIKKDPTQGMRAPSVKPDAVVPYSPEEFMDLWRAASHWPDLMARDHAMLALLYNTGLRAGELCTLRRENIREGRILVRGKGKKERWLTLEPNTQNHLGNYLRDERQRPGRFVFNISPRGLHSVIRRLAWKADVANAYVHRFRDTYAVEFLEHGGAVDDLQVILGHSNIQTTLRYVMYGREKRAGVAMSRFAPFAHRSGSPAA